MKTMTLQVEGVSKKQIQEYIKRNTEGFRLFFHEPLKASYTFLNPFWGYKWEEYSTTQLRDAILTATKINGSIHHFILVFMLNGTDRFAYCSWTNQLYDFETKKYHEIEGHDRLSKRIRDKVLDIMANNILDGLSKLYKAQEAQRV